MPRRRRRSAPWIEEKLQEDPQENGRRGASSGGSAALARRPVGRRRRSGETRNVSGPHSVSLTVRISPDHARATRGASATQRLAAALLRGGFPFLTSPLSFFV